MTYTGASLSLMIDMLHSGSPLSSYIVFPLPFNLKLALSSERVRWRCLALLSIYIFVLL